MKTQNIDIDKHFTPYEKLCMGCKAAGDRSRQKPSQGVCEYKRANLPVSAAIPPSPLRGCRGNLTAYLEPFFVGLFEGDGCLYMRKTKNGKSSYGVLQISLKYLPENVAMLQLIVGHFGGTIQYEKKKGIIAKVKWLAIAQKTVENCLSVFEKYPFLTSRKICQLDHLKQCIKQNSWDYHLETRDSRYHKQKDIIQHSKTNLIIPPYFGPWLSGFTEAEGCFRSTSKLSFYISQNDDWYILNAIKIYLGSRHKLGVNKDSRRPWLDNVQFRVSMSGKPTIENIINHFSKFPLLGYKKVSYEIFCQQYFAQSTSKTKS